MMTASDKKPRNKTKKEKTISSKEKGRSSDDLYKEINLGFKKCLRPFRTGMTGFLEEVFKTETLKAFISSISLLPLECKMIVDKEDTKINVHGRSIIHDLGIAHLAGWAGYTLIDGILDGQQDARSLPVALYLLRHMKETLDLYVDEKSRPLISKLLDAADVEYHRPTAFFTSKSLSRRSLGHSIPALIIASRAGCSQAELLDIMAYFEYYLACRQIADDARDWRDDLRVNHDTAVTLLLKRKLSKTEIRRLCETGTYNDDVRSASDIIVQKVSPLMVAWAEKGLRTLEKTPYKNSPYFQERLMKMKDQAARALG